MSERRKDKKDEVPVNRRQGERRGDQRIPADLWIEAEEGNDLYYQRAANLSAGGAFFAQTVPQPVGTVVQLRFTLPGESSEIHCRGKIVSNPDKLGMGVKFLDLESAARERIEALIAKRE